MTLLDFLLGAFLVILGFGVLSFSARIADRLPFLALVAYGMQRMKEPILDILQAIGLFTLFIGGFILLAMIGSTLLAKGVLLFLPL